MEAMYIDARLAQLTALLEAEGVLAAGVRAAGHEREIAVVEALPSVASRLAVLAPAIRALGFQYVTVDLAAADHDDD